MYYISDLTKIYQQWYFFFGVLLICLQPKLLSSKLLLALYPPISVCSAIIQHYLSLMFCCFLLLLLLLIFFPCNPFLLESASEIRISTTCKNSILQIVWDFIFLLWQNGRSSGNKKNHISRPHLMHCSLITCWSSFNLQRRFWFHNCCGLCGFLNQSSLNATRCRVF